MPIPSTRDELVQSLESSFAKLDGELQRAGAQAGNLPCIDDWSVKDLLVVRAWWTERVVLWIEAGRRGEIPVTPGEGYGWKETPRLNQDLVEGARRESFRSVKQRLRAGYEQVIRVIGELGDRELLDAGAFEWAGNYPLARWISMNTVRQYTTARTHLRRALREAAE